jgi:hypothetical protein
VSLASDRGVKAHPKYTAPCAQGLSHLEVGCVAQTFDKKQQQFATHRYWLKWPILGAVCMGSRSTVGTLTGFSDAISKSSRCLDRDKSKSRRALTSSAPTGGRQLSKFISDYQPAGFVEEARNVKMAGTGWERGESRTVGGCVDAGLVLWVYLPDCPSGYSG